jgi:hypothetical protein
MGYSVSWLAIHQADKAAVYKHLGFAPTGRTGDQDDFAHSGRLLTSGWIVVVLHKVAHPLVHPNSLARLSVGHSLVACNVEEHVMTSSAEFWEGGKELRSIWHQGDQSVDNLETEGNLPAEFTAIERQYRAKQAKDASPRGRLHLRNSAGPSQEDHRVQAR